MIQKLRSGRTYEDYSDLCDEIDAATFRATVDGIDIVSEPLLNAMWDLLSQIETRRPDFAGLGSPTLRTAWDVSEPPPRLVLC